MTEFIVRADDQDSESLFIAYRDERGGVQSVVGQMYQAIKRAETAYADFEAQLAEGQRFETLAAYHTAKQAPVAEAVALLRYKMAEVAGLMEQMQTAMPPEIILFPGVPRVVEPTEEPIAEEVDNAGED
jgi:seryl-tRNA(Sec) selenium transferase